MLINEDDNLIQNAIKLKNLSKINNLTNILLDIYSYKIGREEGATKILKNELKYIEEIMKNSEPFENEYINPFFDGWNEIKEKCTQYKCRSLLDKKEEALRLNISSYLSYFLVDDGERGGGMFLASAFENFISWQNNFINSVINKNKMNGILNSYVSQLEQEIDIQDAKEDEILDINKNTYKYLNDLIRSCSMRNILEKGNKINYEKYNEIEYNYDFIEEELAKKILPGKKKFKNTIKFMTYLYEGFRGGNSEILNEYIAKYPSRELNKMEKDSLIGFISENKSKGIYNDVFSSLQILMNEIIKENYELTTLIYQIIENLPKHSINSQLTKLLQEKYELDINQELKLFSIDCLVPFLEFFESLCWEEIKQNICEDYKLKLSEENKKYIIEYFEKNQKPENIINKKNVTDALRKLMSRSIVGRREEVDIKFDAHLNNYILQEYLWDRKIFEDKNFETEIYKLFKPDILIGNAFDMYLLLGGEDILKEGINGQQDKEIKKNSGDIKVAQGQGVILDNNGGDQIKPNVKPKVPKVREDEEEEEEEGEEKEES